MLYLFAGHLFNVFLQADAHVRSLIHCHFLGTKGRSDNSHSLCRCVVNKIIFPFGVCQEDNISFLIYMFFVCCERAVTETCRTQGRFAQLDESHSYFCVCL